MKQSFTKLLAAFALLVFMTPSIVAWGQTVGTLTLSSSKKFGTESGSTLTDDKNNNWTCVGDHIQNSYNTSYAGQQFGTSKTNDQYTFTADFSNYTVTSVAITAAAGSATPTYNISVGGSTWKTGSLSTTSTNYSETGNGSGNVVITLNQNNGGKAVYLGSITVTYTTGGGGGTTTHTLSYVVTPANAGSVTLSATSLEETGTAEATATANAHFTFASWSISGAGATLTSTTTNPTTVTMGTENATITANFTEDPKYNITYNANYDGFSGDPVVNSNYAGESMTIAAYNIFTRTGYFISGWNTSADGSGTTYNAGDSYTMTSSGLNLYAQWSAGATGTILFGSAEGHIKINSASVSGDDDLGNTWSIITEGTTSFTSSSNYYQVGSSGSPATSITFSTTLPSSVVVNSFSAKFGGFSGTAGTVTLKVDNTTVGTGSLNGSSDVIINSTTVANGTNLTVTVTNIAKGVKCYYISYTYIMGSDPIISGVPNNIALNSLATTGEIPYSIINPVSGRTLTATTEAAWISDFIVSSDKVTFTTTINESTTDDRDAIITLHYEGATNKQVTVTQSKVDYATLPLEYTGNGVYEVPNYFNTNLSGSYGDSPKMKFDATGKYLILHLNEAPTSLSYDIKGNGGSSAWAGTFEVMTSADGETWNDLVTYTTLSGSVQTYTHVDLGNDVRYIKWIYVEKSNGNVALGNIKASSNYDIYGTCTTATLAPTSEKKCTIYEGGVLTITGTLTNTTAANLIIEEGGQLIANNAVNATVQKEIAGFGSDNSVKTGWYTIASPLTTNIVPANNNMLTNTYDLYYYDEADAKWYNHKPNNAHSGFNIEPNKGYLYANSENTTLSFEGEVRASNASVSIPLSYASSNANLKGFNLVGNPFACNITSATNAMLGNGSFSTYYIADGTVNAEGNNLIAYTITDRAIKPGEGFLVQVSAADQSLVFNSRGRSEQNGYIRILAGDESFTDRAYVQFGGGNELRKMTLADNSTKVYVMQDNKDYAAMIIEEGQNEIPVNFKAAANGNYTMTIDAEGVEMNYLHLIDNMTGMDVDLLQTPSYTFDATTNDYTSRFRLVFSANNVDGPSTGSGTFAFYSNGNWVIGNEGEATLQVIDINGRIVSNETINGSVNKTITATPGIYMLRLVNGNEVKTQKIVVR